MSMHPQWSTDPDRLARDGCSHGRSWAETCHDCRTVAQKAPSPLFHGLLVGLALVGAFYAFLAVLVWLASRV